MPRTIPSPMARMLQARTSRMEALDTAQAARLRGDTSSAIARYIAQYHPEAQMQIADNIRMPQEPTKDAAQAKLGSQFLNHQNMMERQLLTDELSRERMEEEYRLRDLVQRRAHGRGRGSKKDRIIKKYIEDQKIYTREGPSAPGKAAKMRADRMIKRYDWLKEEPRVLYGEGVPTEEKTLYQRSAELRSTGRYSSRQFQDSMTQLTGREFKLERDIIDLESKMGSDLGRMDAERKYGDINKRLKATRGMLQGVRQQINRLRQIGAAQQQTLSPHVGKTLPPGTVTATHPNGQESAFINGQWVRTK